MDKEIKKILTDGLLSGYAGKGEITDVTRAGFKGKASHIEQDSTVYHDEWYTGESLGGGQELVSVGDRMYTRLYAGGTPNPEILEKLGITHSQVNQYLKDKIVELAEKTRLLDNCTPNADGEWQYEYKMLLVDKNIPVKLSAESIFYKGTRVHLHPFILSPIE